MKMQHLVVKGTPYEQGVQQGRACAGAIRFNRDQILRLIRSLDRGDAAWYDRLLAMNKAYIEKVDPDTLEEIEGLAFGSGMKLDDVLKMNLPVYMILRRTKVIEECSVFAIAAEATAEARTFLAKTRDQDVTQFQFEHVLLQRHGPDGRRIVEVNGAGIITNPGSGMNDRGLTVGTAGAWSRSRIETHVNQLAQAHAMPDMHYLLRRAGSVAEAVDLFKSFPRLAGMNLVVADRSGAMGTLEITVDDAYFTPAQDGYAAITNHYLHPDLAHMNDTPEEYPSTYARCRRIQAVLGPKPAGVTFRQVLGLLMDQQDGPQDSICRSSDDGSGSVTRYASVCVVEDFETWAFDGLPSDIGTVARG